MHKNDGLEANPTGRRMTRVIAFVVSFDSLGISNRAKGTGPNE
jgi:hypothetical protein